MIRGTEPTDGTTTGAAIDASQFTDAEVEIFMRAAALVRDAIEAGITLQIVHKPRTPLAMGYYIHEVTTAAARVLALPETTR